MTNNHYTSSKIRLYAMIRAERSDRYAAYKIDRTGDGVTGPRLVREMYAAGDTIRKIAQRFGVTEQAVRDCVAYRTYANV